MFRRGRHVRVDADKLSEQIADMRHVIEVQDAALEEHRQWRLNSLPALLDAEARAKRAEARVAELEADLGRVMVEAGHHEVMVMGNHGGGFLPLREAIDYWRAS